MAHQVVLTWTPSIDDANPNLGYNIFKGAAQGKENAAPLNSSPVAVGATTPAQCTYTDTAVEAGEEYWYYIESVVESGSSPATAVSSSAPSMEVSATVPLAPPTGLQAVAS